MKVIRIPTVQEDIEKLEFADIPVLQQILDSLYSKREKVFYDEWVNGKTLKEIGLNHGLTEGYVSKLVKRYKRKSDV